MIQYMRYLLRICTGVLLFFSVFASAGLLTVCVSDGTAERTAAGDGPDMLIVYCAFS